jgi:predicted cupin superfamily sugar epimerase
MVPAGWWQAARSLGAWSLASCCVGPGFDFADFTLLRDLHPAQHPGGALSLFL